MNRKDSKLAEKQQSFWEKYSSPPMDFLMRNPKMTPVILLVLAVVPIATVVLILGIVAFGQ